MSNQALDLLIEAGLITASGKLTNLSKLSNEEVTVRISQYINSRKDSAICEVETYGCSESLNALFSTSSSKVTKEKLLSSALIYESIIIDDPLVNSTASFTFEQLEECLGLFAWAFKLIRSGFIKILPLSYFNRPSDKVPLLHSDDSFRSAIPEKIHDFIHKNAILKSVVRDEKGQMLILNEDAFVKRRTALHVSFIDDYWASGPSLYLLQTIENSRENESGEFIIEHSWDSKRILSKERFEFWSYQSINQAMRARLINIYNESHLSAILGHTYITESPFESKLLSMSGEIDEPDDIYATKFLEANNSFISISSPETIIELRTKYFRAFERFNHTLLFVSGELSRLDPKEFDQKAKNLFYSEILPQIDEFRDGANSISTACIKGGIACLVGFSAAIITGSSLPLVPALMLSVASGLTEALPSISQRHKIKMKPAYIWHRLTKT